MSRILHFLLIATVGVCLLGALVACRPQQVEDERVLKVGIIASLSGPARPWGLATVRCAQVVADYHNERGGFDLDGEKVQIELVIKDDGYNASQAASVAHDLTVEGVNYVIGPLGDAQVSAASRVLDGTGVFYVHYGFNRELQRADSLGILGMPLPEQSLPVLLDHLRAEEGVSSVLILAYGTDEGIRQKGIAEFLASKHGLNLVKLSRFDVSEETFDLDMNMQSVSRRVERVVEASPDALIIAGCPPESFVVFVDRLRSGGYEGFICTQNFQDPSLLAKLGQASDDVFYVGGTPADGLRSEYYGALKGRYLDLAEEWSEEADTKLYALEFIIACLQRTGVDSLEETSLMYRTLEEMQFHDPFYIDDRLIPVTGGIREDLPKQIRTPIRISRMLDGEAFVVEETKGELR